MNHAEAEERTAGREGRPALDELVSGVAEELEGVSRVAAENAPGWQDHSRGRSAFARVSRDVLEVRLPADIAEAALRTPDTSMLPGRPGWLRFAPASAERHVRDRAEAWYRTAWRHTGGQAKGRGG